MIYKHFDFRSVDQVLWQYRVGSLFEYELVEILGDWEYTYPSVDDLDDGGVIYVNSWMFVRDKYDEDEIPEDTFWEIDKRRRYRALDEIARFSREDGLYDDGF